jgi:hypothetical protein
LSSSNPLWGHEHVWKEALDEDTGQPFDECTKCGIMRAHSTEEEEEERMHKLQSKLYSV